MPLTIGTQLGSHEIVAMLGKGGMGDVYRARDTKLKRDVAIKILPDEFSRDPDRVSRFQREAEVLASLNHPNIAAIYDLQEADSAAFLVLELLEGETLRERLAQGALPARRAMDYALQVARGLAAAHEKGIVHRDLKPENLFVTKDGPIKILDFGLAKLKQPQFGAVSTNAPTNPPQTEPGVVMGTAGYMPPEQVRGQDTDHRSDIFSFGVILYEMLTGKRAFQAASTVEVLNAILKEEPDLAERGGQVSPGLERVLRHCLEKDPRMRFQSANDLAFAIEALSMPSDFHASVSGQARTGSIASRWHPRGRALWISAAALFFITTVALAWFELRRAPTAGGTIRFSIPPPEKTAFVPISDIPYSVAVSPDGQHLALAILADGRTQLWVRSLSGLSAQPLAGTEGAGNPFWSSDSRYIGFFAGGKLKKIEASGGPPQTLCDAPRALAAATWSREGVILFGSVADGIYRVPADGGQPALVIKSDGFKWRFWPAFLPDGRHFLFIGSPGPDNHNELYAGSLDSGDFQTLLKDAPSRAVYAPPGYLLYVRDGTLLAHPFDAQALRFTGDPIKIAEGLWYFEPSANADFSVSQTGVLAYRAGTSVSRFTWVDRRGMETGSVGTPKDFSFPRISPDGESVAVNVTDPRNGTVDVWTYHLSRGLSTRVTFAPWMEWSPIWSPDGRRIVFGADINGPPHLYQKAVGDTGIGEMLLPQSGWVQWPYDWTPDGRFILYGDGEAKTGDDLMILPLEGDRKPKPWLRTQFNETDARISPDGRWVGYVSDESGRTEIYVRSFADPEKGGKRQISTGGGMSPRWRRNGKELFYIDANKRLMAVPVGAGPTFETGTPAALFQVEARQSQYDVAADGQRFLINTTVAEANTLPLTVVVNWNRDLKR